MWREKPDGANVGFEQMSVLDTRALGVAAWFVIRKEP